MWHVRAKNLRNTLRQAAAKTSCTSSAVMYIILYKTHLIPQLFRDASFDLLKSQPSLFLLQRPLHLNPAGEQSISFISHWFPIAFPPGWDRIHHSLLLTPSLRGRGGGLGPPFFSWGGSVAGACCQITSILCGQLMGSDQSIAEMEIKTLRSICWKIDEGVALPVTGFIIFLTTRSVSLHRQFLNDQTKWW